jgi:cytochrome d ubiquinol oxidase subunit II
VRFDSEQLWDDLMSWPAIAAVIVSALAGIAALGLLATRRLEHARVVSVVAVAAVIAGWALAQNPYILPGLTVDQAAAGRATLIAVLVGLAIGSVILIPSLAVLYRMVLRGTFDESANPGTSPLTLEDPGAGDSNRATALCFLGLAAGALILVVGEAAWSIALGVSLLLIAGSCGFFVVARSLASADY